MTKYTEITLATWNVQIVLTQERMEIGSRQRPSSARSEKIELMTDRSKWKDIVQRTKAHNGL
jgi:hypothetical protein